METLGSIVIFHYTISLQSILLIKLSVIKFKKYLRTLFAKIQNFEHGSGYDVACSGAGTPILYFANDDEVSYTPVDFKPSFKKNLYFVHLNQKADTSIGIKEYLKAVKKKKAFVTSATEISEAMSEAKDVSTFSALMDKHEDLVAHHTGFKKVKDERFSDYHGSVKSLGAWGGDFALATSSKSATDTKAYFSGKGYNTVLSYDEMI